MHITVPQRTGVGTNDSLGSSTMTELLFPCLTEVPLTNPPFQKPPLHNESRLKDLFWEGAS